MYTHTFSEGSALYLSDLDGEGSGEGGPRGDHRQHHRGVGGQPHVNIHCIEEVVPQFMKNPMSMYTHNTLCFPKRFPQLPVYCGIDG